jgi:hypothetical protein
MPLRLAAFEAAPLSAGLAGSFWSAPPVVIEI